MVNSRSMSSSPGQGSTSPVSPVTCASSTMQASFRCGRRDSGDFILSSPSLFARSTGGWPGTATSGKNASTGWKRHSKKNASDRRSPTRSKTHEPHEQACNSGSHQPQAGHGTDISGVGGGTVGDVDDQGGF